MIDGSSTKKGLSELISQVRKARPQINDLADGTADAFTNAVKIGSDGIGEIKSIGQQTTTAISNGFQEIEDGVDALKSAENNITMNNFGLDPALLQSQMGETAKVAQNTFRQMASASEIFKDALGDVGGAFVTMGLKASGSYDAINLTLGLLQQLNGVIQGTPDFNRRATGGPVEAGKTYTVNDGGGRESFLDNSGNLSLLPASRNMKWRAPKSGMVLPSGVTERIIERDRINQTLSKSGTSAKPSVSRVSVDGMASPGTLIKQMGAMMKGGDTQRITNNVTIQSQSPVMDASEILVNVSKLRARRGIG